MMMMMMCKINLLIQQEPNVTSSRLPSIVNLGSGWVSNNNGSITGTPALGSKKSHLKILFKVLVSQWTKNDLNYGALETAASPREMSYVLAIPSSTRE